MKKLKCEACGGMMNIDEDKEYATCTYCNTKYKLNEDKKIIIKFDNNEQNDIPKSKAEYIVTIIITFIVIIFIGFICFFTLKSVIQQKKTISNNLNDTNINNTESEIYSDINDMINEQEINSFNSKFEIRSGTQYKSTINFILDDVVTNNKKNKDMLITVVYRDTNTTDPDTIVNVKQSLQDWTKYEVKLDYDNNGYVNKVTIEDIN